MHIAAGCCAASQGYIAVVARSISRHPMLGHAMPSNPNPSLPPLLESCCQGPLQSVNCTTCQQCMDNAALSKLQGLGADGRPSGGMKGRIQCSSGVCRSMKCCREDVWGSGSEWGSSACRNKDRAAPAQHPYTCLQLTCCSQWDFAMVSSWRCGRAAAAKQSEMLLLRAAAPVKYRSEKT